MMGPFAPQGQDDAGPRHHDVHHQELRHRGAQAAGGGRGQPAGRPADAGRVRRGQPQARAPLPAAPMAAAPRCSPQGQQRGRRAGRQLSRLRLPLLLLSAALLLRVDDAVAATPAGIRLGGSGFFAGAAAGAEAWRPNGGWLCVCVVTPVDSISRLEVARRLPWYVLCCLCIRSDPIPIPSINRCIKEYAPHPDEM